MRSRAFDSQLDTYEGGVTALVIGSSLVAAMGAFIFGFDLGMPGGVTSMKPFLMMFFPSVQEKMLQEKDHEDQYCKFNNLLLTLFTSSLYLVALVASLFASIVSRTFGRTASMSFAGRLLFGVGIGFTNHAAPIYLSEISPAKNRRALNIYGFQLAVTIGILIANVVNYHTAKIKGGWGWRVSLSLAAIPALVMISGYLFLPDTPNSILERGNTEKAKEMLQRIRGTKNVEREFQDILDASEAAKKWQNQWKNILQRRYRPQLVMSSVTSAVITGCVNVLATFLSIYYVDRFGRRALLREGGIQMAFCLFVIGLIIGSNFGISGKGALSKADANLLLILVCAFVAAYACSWGPLGWLVPSEICPLEIRSAGQALTVSVNMFFTFFFAQAFLTLLCQLKFGFF
ncbi:hypothetical protein CRYUN_Cryun10bG0100300 [Craigia yunnanensis]